MGKNVTTRVKKAVAKVSDLSVEELRHLIKETVVETLDEMLGDPDEGLELREEFVARLKKSLESPEPTIPMEEAAARLGLKW